MAVSPTAAAGDGEALTYQEAIPPFWSKLGFFFAYPLKFGPLVVIGVLSLASAVAAFAGGLLRGLIAYLFLRYAFSVMEQAASGDLNADSPDINIWGGKDHRPAKQTVVFLVYMAILFGLANVATVPLPPRPADAARVEAAATTGTAPSTASEQDDDEDAPAADRRASRHFDMPDSATEPEPRTKLAWWFYVLAILCAIPLPAAIMVIAVEDRLVSALNPLTTLAYLKGMGAAYLLLWLFFALIFVARAGVVALLPDMASVFRVPIETFVGSYLMLALFAMMGYCLYQYHQELGYQVKMDFDSHRAREAAAVPDAKPKDPLTQKIDAAVAAGKVDDALRYVLDELRFEKLDPGLHERAHKLYVLKGDVPKIVAHGQAYLKALVAAKRPVPAMQLAKKLKDIDPAFEPAPEVLLGLAECAYAVKDYDRAIELVRGFDKRFPGHADVPGVYLLGAKITCEHIGQRDKAIQILKVLLQRFPEAPVKDEAARYLATLSAAVPAA